MRVQLYTHNGRVQHGTCTFGFTLRASHPRDHWKFDVSVHATETGYFFVRGVFTYVASHRYPSDTKIKELVELDVLPTQVQSATMRMSHHLLRLASR